MAVGGFDGQTASLSSWRAWIEIDARMVGATGRGSLSSWRAWIEIPMISYVSSFLMGRSPHGERGLKFDGVTA